MNKFEANYHNKGILWRGWVVKITLNDTAPLSMQYHAALILMKMEEEDELISDEEDKGYLNE